MLVFRTECPIAHHPGLQLVVPLFPASFWLLEVQGQSGRRQSGQLACQGRANLPFAQD